MGGDWGKNLRKWSCGKETLQNANVEEFWKRGIGGGSEEIRVVVFDKSQKGREKKNQDLTGPLLWDPFESSPKSPGGKKFDSAQVVRRKTPPTTLKHLYKPLKNQKHGKKKKTLGEEMKKSASTGSKIREKTERKRKL